MKKVVCILLALCFLGGCIPIVSAETTDTISRQEVVDLMEASALAYQRIHENTEDWFSGGPFRIDELTGSVSVAYNTVEKMSAYYRTIYTEDIADRAWMYAASRWEIPEGRVFPPARWTPDGVLIFTERSDGTIEIYDNFDDFARQQNYYNAAYEDVFPFDLVQNIQGDANYATADVVCQYRDTDSPVGAAKVQVAFRNTNEGWRIANSQYLDFLLKNKLDDVDLIITSDDNAIALLIDVYIRECLQEKHYSFPDGGLLYGSYRFEKIEKDKVYLTFIIEVPAWRPKKVSAEVLRSTETPGVPYYAHEYYPGYWLVGGSIVETELEKPDIGDDNPDIGDDNPDTGDNTQRTIPVCAVIMILSAVAALAIFGRKKKTES